MKLASYLKYKPSNFEWLGDMPAHWEVRRLRHAVNMRVSNVDKHIKDGERPVRLCNYVDVYKNDRITDSVPFMKATANANEIDRFRLEPEDILITKDSEVWNDIGVPALVEYSAKDLICGYHLALLRPLKAMLNGAYLFRSLQSSAIAYQFHIAANGVTRYGLSHHAIKSSLLPLPPLAEQAAIVRYLDHIDGRIRRYISAKERLIGLLEEQRQAVIHRAVTRGLDPDVRLKPSGIEWLGDVPAHWEVRRLKHSVTLVMGQSPPGSDCSDEPIGLPFLQGCAEFGERHPNPVQFCRASQKISPIGAILLSVRAPVGRLNIANQVYGIGRGLCAILPHKEVLQTKFAHYQLEILEHGLRLVSTGSTYDAVSVDGVGNQPMIVPPLAEQTAIVEYLDKATADVDAAIARARRHIELLHEYRTHLIADVVTGKLDVREVAENLPDEPKRTEPINEADDLASIDDHVVNECDVDDAKLGYGISRVGEYGACR